MALKIGLLAAISQKDRAPVLLIDEVDRADEEFEAFLLEVLGDFQVSIPEIGTVKATHRPLVILTSNRSRDLSDALRRRCLYLWIDYPDSTEEEEIVRTTTSVERRGYLNRAGAPQCLQPVCFGLEHLRRRHLVPLQKEGIAVSRIESRAVVDASAGSSDARGDAVTEGRLHLLPQRSR